MSEASGAPAPGRFGATLRRDAWWVEILPVAAVLGLFAIYATARAFEGRCYKGGPYLSPFHPSLIDPQQSLLGHAPLR